MARIRTIKPSIARHSELFDAEKETGMPLRFAWAVMPTICDREGRFRWNPRELKFDVLPHDNLDFSRVLDAFVTRGMLVKYRVGDAWFGVIPTFRKHQVINNKESASELPPPESADEVYSPCNHKHTDASSTREERVDDAFQSSLGKDQGEGEGKGREKEGEEEVQFALGCAEAPPVVVHVEHKPPKQAAKPAAERATRLPKPLGVADLVAEGVSEQHAADWLAVRKAKRAPLTDTALADLKREAAKAGLSLDEAVRIAAARNWQGFRADWDWRDSAAKPAATGARPMTKQEALEAQNRAVGEEWATRMKAQMGANQ